MRALASAFVLATLITACGGGTAAPSAAPATPPPSAAATAAATPAPPKVSLKFNWNAASGSSSGLWTAFEAGYFKDENIDVELTNIASSTRAVAALLAKDVQFAHMDGQVLIDANLGGADLRLIYGINNRLVFSVMTKKEIKTPQDLKGKKVGVTTPGSSTHTALLLALRNWGLKESDVGIVSLNEVPNILTALIAGQIDAGVMSPPTNTRAKAAGFNELVNLATDGPEWPSIAVAARADYLKADPTIAERVIRAYARGVQRFKSDKPFGIEVLKKYLKLDDQAVLEDTWGQYRIYLAEVPYVLGMQTTLDVVAEGRAEAKKLKLDELVDSSYVKKLDDAGFFKKLYGK